MNRKRTMVFLALAALLALGGCAGAGQTTKTTSSSSSSTMRTVSKTEPEAKADVVDEDASAKSSAGSSAAGGPDEVLDVSDRVPYKGMAAAYIDKTWLGPADKVGDQISGGKYAGAVPYDWYARNGTDDLVFTAYVKNDEVVGVAKSSLGKNYWGDGSSVVSSELPDLEASGEAVGAGSSTSAAKPNPDGWDDAEDYANANSDRFKSWAEAYDYWLEEMS